MPPDAPTAFFSYSREDSEFALRLAGDLKAAGAGVWIDQLDIDPGQEWDNAIEDAVTQSPRMLLILTAASVKSKKVRNEIAFALDEQKTIIPVLCQDCMVPLQLRRIQHIDFRTDYARGLKALLKTLGAEQQMAASAAAASVASPESQPVVSDAQRKGATEQALEEARLEEARRLAAVSAAAEQVRLEQERRQAAEQARPEEEREQAAAEKARLEQQERERLAAAEIARLEQQQRERFEKACTGAPVPLPASASPAFKKIALAACPVLVAAFFWYWTTRPKQPEVRTQTLDVKTQPSSPPLAAETSSSGAAAGQGAEVKQQATESLSAQAMYDKGDDYYYGRNGVSKDYKQAFSWYRKAAQAGNTNAMNDVGLMYERGEGVEKDQQQAVSWYRKAAQVGNVAGMINLGTKYRDGDGVNRDYRQAVTWYRKAAETGEPWGMSNLGWMYTHGYGVSKDYKQAVSWYRKAAEAGNMAGMRGLGAMYYNGWGVQIDYNQAVSWTRKAAEAGDAEAMSNLGLMYENGTGVEKDLQQAVSWYRKSAEAGDAQGMASLAEMYEHGKGVTKDYQQALTLYRKAAQLGNQYAKDALKRLGESP